ncbi:MAG: glycosyl transferase group 1 protein [Bacteroidetes bacterium]|nr:MAG: glycosyl transferase group 1 protein [Bacteroidota bacterium]
MRIALVTHEYPPDTGFGGISTYSVNLVLALRGIGVETEVFCASFERELSECYRGIATHRIKVSHSPDFPRLVVKPFARRHKEKPFDLIECPEIGGEALEITKQFPDLPLVVRLHAPAVLITRMQNSLIPFHKKLRFVAGNLRRGRIDFGYWSRGDKNQHADRDFLITEAARHISSPSKKMKEWATSFWKIDPARISVIPNPFDPDPVLLKIPADTNTKRITFYGRLNVLKGLVPLTKALKTILRNNPEWSMRFAGKDENAHIEGMRMKQYIEKELEAFNDQLEWFDWVEKESLPELLRESDIVVIPSLFESFSYVCAEAMSAARGIVGSRRGGMPELLGDTGILIDPKSPSAISRAVQKLISDPARRISYGEAARERLLRACNPEIVAKEMHQLYLSVLQA